MGEEENTKRSRLTSEFLFCTTGNVVHCNWGYQRRRRLWEEDEFFPGYIQSEVPMGYLSGREEMGLGLRFWN